MKLVMDKQTKRRMSRVANSILYNPTVRFVETRTDDDGLLSAQDFLNELGFTIYEDPIRPNCFWISNMVLTIQWYIENQHRYSLRSLTATHKANLQFSEGEEELDELL